MTRCDRSRLNRAIGGCLFAAALLAPATALGVDPAVVRALEDLRSCTQVDEALCRSVPGRLSNYGDRAVRPLVKAFPTLSSAGQILGIISLQRIETRRATRALIGLSTSSNYVVRTLTLTVLGDRPGRYVDRALIVALKDVNPAIREAAAEALGKAPRVRSLRMAVPALIQAIDDPASEVVSAAVGSLGVLGDKRAVPRVMETLSSSNRGVRRSALFALRFLRDARSVPHLIEILREPDAELRENAGKTLERVTGAHLGVDYELWKGWWEAHREELLNL